MSPAPTRYGVKLLLHAPQSWIAFGIMLFFLTVAILPNLETNFRAMLLIWPGAPETTGTIQGAQKESPDGVGQDVWSYEYVFDGPDGHQHKGRSFTDGKIYGQGQRIPVVYSAGNPNVSRARDMRTSYFSYPFNLFIALTAALGIFVFYRRLRTVRTTVRLLDGGKQAAATLRRIVNQDPGAKSKLYRITFDFYDAGGIPRQCTFQSVGKKKFDAGLPKTVLYDPVDPNVNVLLESLPESVVRAYQIRGKQ